MATVLEEKSTTAIIRLGTMADAPRIVQLGRDFLLAGPYKEYIADNPVQAMEICTKLLASPDGRVLVAEVNGEVVGLLALYFYKHYFSGELTASELIWYVEKDHRSDIVEGFGNVSLALIWRAQQIAIEFGATCMQLTAPSPEIGKIYEKFGYKMIEVGYQRRLNAGN